MGYNLIGLCANIINTILGSNFDILRRAYLLIQEDLNTPFIFYNFCISGAITRLETKNIVCSVIGN